MNRLLRNLVVFLVALGVGAMTVVGQEDKNADLIRRIADLEKILKKRAAEQRVPRDNMVIQRAYEVADLIATVRDGTLVPSNLFPSKYSFPETEDREPIRSFEVDVLIDMMRAIEPDTWDQVENADIAPKNSHILVTNVPRVHTGIARLLAQLREELLSQIVIDVVALAVNEETAALLAQRPRELSEKEAAKLAAIAPLGTLRLTGLNGQRIMQRSGTRRSYLQDYDVEIAQAAAIGDPIQREVFEGCAAEVRACLDRSAGGVVLHCRLERTKIHTPMRRLDTQHGPLDLPKMDLTRITTSFWAPLGKTVVAGGTTGGRDPVVFLITARLAE